MIAEIPDPVCVGAGSPFAPGIQNARSEFDARYTPTTSFQVANIPVEVMGVGFFDFQHGQTGVAPNGIELHPVLDVVFNPSGVVGDVPPVANFSDSINGLIVAFTNTSTDSDGTVVSSAWNFGDGSTSTATSPSHAYALGGTYNVSLTATDNGGKTNTVTKSIVLSSGSSSQLLGNTGFENSTAAPSSVAPACCARTAPAPVKRRCRLGLCVAGRLWQHARGHGIASSQHTGRQHQCDTVVLAAYRYRRNHDEQCLRHHESPGVQFLGHAARNAVPVLQPQCRIGLSAAQCGHRMPTSGSR